MARGIICDRCGRVIKLPNENYYRMVIYRAMRNIPNAEVDICEECKHELIDLWLNGNPCGAIIKEENS